MADMVNLRVPLDDDDPLDHVRNQRELTNAIKGNEGWGTPFRLNKLNDPVEWAVHARNKDTTNSPALLAETHDGARSLKVDKTDTHGTKAGGGLKVLSGGLDVAGAGLLRGTLEVVGAADLDSTLNVDGAATLQSTLLVSGAATLNSTLGVVGAATLYSTLQVNGAVTLSGLLTANANAAFNAELLMNGSWAITIATATTATTGAHGAPPAQVAGYIPATIGGNVCMIPFYND